ncbi:MAG: ribonuclease Z [Actinomycetota bacterium]|nr:ribonuclease Z [Actinomycetota bacterium]
MDLDVLFVGTAGSAPTARRGLPATLVRRGGERLLFDCGEGTQRQLMRSAGLIEIDDVFLTHFHADHVLGLPGMLKTYGLQARERPVTVHGPPGLGQLFETLAPLIGRTPYEVRVQEIEAGTELRRDGYVLAAFAVDHGPPALGWTLVEDERPGVFDPTTAEELGVRPGPDFGRLQRGVTVTGTRGEVHPDQVMGESRAGRKLVLTGDTAPCQMTAAVAHDADLLVHEATFLDEEAERARLTRHATAGGAARLAAEAGVRMLALTHVSSRHTAADIRDEARAAFEGTIVPRDFDRVVLPFRERGEPEHVRGESV